MAQYEITLRDYWRILRRRKSIVAFTALLLGFFSFLMASVWKPTPLFKAAAKVQINSSQTLTGLYLEAIAYNAGDQIETQQAIITSYPVLKLAGEELGLFAGGDTARVVLDLQNRIVTSQEGYTNIIIVEATDGRPRMARELANTIARVYRDYNYELKNQQAIKHRNFVEVQRDKAREALMQAEEEVRLYREETDLVSLDAQASVMLGQITQGEQNATSLEQTVHDIDIMLEEMEEQGGLSEKTMQGATKVQVGEAFMNLTYQLNNLRLDRDGLLVKLTENHPQIAQLQAKIDQLSRNLMDELRQRQQAVRRDVKAIRSRLSDLHRDYGQLPSRGLKLGRLQREVLLRQEVVGVLEGEYQNALIREADKVEEVALLQWAITPTDSINPSSPVTRGIMGIVLGLVLGVVFAVVAETLDTSIGTIEDVQEYTGTQVVGVIPFIDVDDVEESLERRGRAEPDRHTLERKAQLVAYFDPQSTLAETFRTLRTNIEFVTVEKGAKTLMITSSTAQEGKSTVMANLAMTMAQLGKRSLLVDCDLRKPSVARLFGLDKEKEPGLAEVIVGNYEWRDVVRTVTDIVTGGMGMEDITQTQGISNLHIITSGAIPPNPAELLNSRQMTDFLGEVEESYDVILIDAPPVLHVTDAAILGKKVDGTLVVYKAGDVPRTSLRRAVNLLRSVEVELLGMVLNGIRADTTTDYQDFGYSSYYAYGSNDTLRKRSPKERLQEWVAKWRGQADKRDGGFSQEGEYEGEDEDEREKDEEDKGFDEIGELNPDGESGAREEGSKEKRKRKTGRTVASSVLLTLVALGIAWQSGYLAKPLGLIPVFAVYQPESFRAAEQPVATERTVDEEEPEERPVAEIKTDPETVEVIADPDVEETEDVRALPVPSAAEDSAEPEIEISEPDERDEEREALVEEPPDPDLESGLTWPSQPYTIRVAAYVANSGWARRFLGQLRKRGEDAFWAPIRVGEQRMVRLLVGLFLDWDQALEHAQKLKRLGILEEFTIARMPYAVELIVLDDPRQVEQAMAQLGERGFFAYAQPGDGGNTRLLAGAFETEEEANRFAVELAGEVGFAQVVSR